MPNKLIEKARCTAERAAGLRKSERKPGFTPFQGAPIKARQEIAEKNR